ncbi:MAG: response regulator transcription factor, partial [Rhodospirillales bacterium]|nr:response regulator transcription factor [Acetobacter sp.]
MTEPIRILMVDDHPLLREGITMVLAQEKDMLLVGAAPTGREAVSLYTTTRPDLVLMDLRLPDMSGIDAMTAIRASSPRAKVVILTTFEGDAEVSRALNAGAAGYLLKSMPRKQIVEAL